MTPCRVAVAGLGAIALRRHLPVIAAHPRFEVVASCDPNPVATVEGGTQYRDHRAMLAAEPGIDAVVICSPPDVRCRIALDAIAAGKHVLLEKPPCATLGELRQVAATARRAGVTLMASWHSRYSAAVERARAILADQEVAAVEMVWKEDASALHAHKSWMWRPGGFGVFDCGINGLSILTELLPDPLVVRAATLWVPKRWETPIAAEIDFAGRREEDRLHATIEWRTRDYERSIAVVTRAGQRLWLPVSGQRLEIDGILVVDEGNQEYQRLYDRFAGLLDRAGSDVDDGPLVAVSDVFAIARRIAVEDDL
jgi:predicted dehydrogenase